MTPKIEEIVKVVEILENKPANRKITVFAKRSSVANAIRFC
jgi:hypothetical protein